MHLIYVLLYLVVSCFFLCHALDYILLFPLQFSNLLILWLEAVRTN